MAEASDRPAPFVASDEFAGARDGYYFRLGENGLGYYEDVNRGRAPSSLLTAASSSDAREDASDADDSEHKKPSFKVDLFDWYRKRLLRAVGKRTAPLVDTGEVVIRVTSLWPHGAVGVVDSASAESPDDAGSVAISCDVGVSVEWRAVVKLVEESLSSDEKLEALSGTIQWTAEVAVQHGLTDERGRQPLSSRTLRQVTGLKFLPASWVVPWFVLRWLSPRYPSVKRTKEVAPPRAIARPEHACEHHVCSART